MRSHMQRSRAREDAEAKGPVQEAGSVRRLSVFDAERGRVTKRRIEIGENRGGDDVGRDKRPDGVRVAGRGQRPRPGTAEEDSSECG
jgi:hypothetical protein